MPPPPGPILRSFSHPSVVFVFAIDLLVFPYFVLMFRAEAGRYITFLSVVVSRGECTMFVFSQKVYLYTFFPQHIMCVGLLNLQPSEHKGLQVGNGLPEGVL